MYISTLRDKVDEFTNELNITLDNIKWRNPYVNLVVGDFNAQNTAWWWWWWGGGGDTDDYPGESISIITGLHGLHEIINPPTHFYPGKNLSYIDIIFCSQPNLISESGVTPSLLPQCHHDITYAKIDLNVKNPPPYKSIRRSLSSVNWVRGIQHRNPTNQVEFLTNCIYKTFSNFCPHKIVKC